MTAASLPEQLLTSAEFAALPGSERRYELQGGSIVMSPSPIPRHQIGILRLAAQLMSQVPRGLEVVPGLDVDLELVPPSRPGYVRVPDVLVATGQGIERRDREGGVLRASEVVLAVEVQSPGTARIDRTLKRAEYADAGIPHYWMIDVDDRATLTACHLAGEFGYVDGGPLTGVVTAEDPFPLRVDLDALLRR